MAVLFLVIALGAFFRIYHTEWKIYSPDETNTSLRLSGHTVAQVTNFILDGQLHHVSDLDAYARPNATTTPGEIWQSLASEDPQHPPLFFLATFASERLTGDSVFFRRLPAIVFGILAIAAAYWFGRELFGESLPAWLLTALVAISPFHVAFAQNAREYSLFLLSICVSSALLLAALRTGNRLALAGYALSVCLGCWGFTLFLLVAAAQGLYALLPASGAPPARRGWVLLALCLGVLTFVPWLANLVRNAGVAVNDTTWQATSLPASLYVGKWVFNVASVFFDLDYVSLLWLPLALLTIAISLAACFVFARGTGARVWLLPLLVGAIPLIAMGAPDLLRHETRALQSRYLTATWLALEVGTAGGLWLALKSARGFALGAWRFGLSALLICGVLSCAVASQARSWWTTGRQSVRVMPAIDDKLHELDAPTIVYLGGAQDEILMLQPDASPSLSFRLHRRLDAATLRSAAHPYAILSSEEMSRVAVARELKRIPVVETFEMRPDPAIDQLRRRGAASRNLEYAGRLDFGLYGLADPATRP
jgi:uncharacterized membrane protein